MGKVMIQIEWFRPKTWAGKITVLCHWARQHCSAPRVETVTGDFNVTGQSCEQVGLERLCYMYHYDLHVLTNSTKESEGI